MLSCLLGSNQSQFFLGIEDRAHLARPHVGLENLPHIAIIALRLRLGVRVATRRLVRVPMKSLIRSLRSGSAGHS